MSVVLFATGCILMAVGLMMQANRAGYVYLVVGARTVLAFAGMIGMLVLFWMAGGKRTVRLPAVGVQCGSALEAHGRDGSSNSALYFLALHCLCDAPGLQHRRVERISRP